MTIGEKIKQLREEKGINQTEMGKRLQMTQRKISYLERNTSEPSTEDIRSICLFFNISADYLLNLPKNMNYPEGEE